jgi:type IV pilus assembly protein PilA
MKNTEKGFTLIELLVVIAIIGILAAIAIPQFAEFRKRGFDARAKTDLRNVATAEEAYYADEETYLDVSDDNLGDLPGIDALSDGTTLSIDVNEEGDGFTGTSSHNKGTGKEFSWDSKNGGLQSDAAEDA